MKVKDIAGQRFGRLVAISRENRRVRDRARTFWVCRCDCGTTKEVRAEVLLRGHCESCGCLQREMASRRMRTHGRSGSRLHGIWRGIIDRCTNPHSEQFHNYGGRGIAVCASWRHSFESFAADVGEPPSMHHSIDRWPDYNGNYEPGNVRWATAQKQGRNRRGLVEVDYQGRRVCLTEAAEMAGIAYGTVYNRIFRHGWSVEDALGVPAERLGRPSKLTAEQAMAIYSDRRLQKVIAAEYGLSPHYISQIKSGNRLARATRYVKEHQ